ncbi:MAG: hypothetical protein SGJ17_06165 [Hyphomicrobiales bacterium]|nr:hypothetical protein [Hyphomicrobiales bacterium]
MANTELGDSKNLLDDPKYKIFAFIVWNFLESVYDTSQTGKADWIEDPENIWGAWKGVVMVEGRLHSSWLKDASNQANFKEEFLNFIRNNGIVPDLEILGGQNNCPNFRLRHA